jgi:hypothetical protein
MSQAIVGGLGLPGNLTALALLRQDWDVIAADPKVVTARTLARVYTPGDVGKPKPLALRGQASALGRLDQLDARCGRLEDVVGGQEWRNAQLVLLAADRPSATRRVASICMRLATADKPLRLITCHVAEGAAQVRTFAFPAAALPCPLCGSGDQFLSSVLNEADFSCEQSATGGDAFTMPYGAVEGYAAAALALQAIGGPAGVDTTLALGPSCEAFTSRLRQDPACLLQCATVAPWPEATAQVADGEALRPALTRLARDAGFATGTARVEFLRPMALGTVCGCGRHEAPRVFCSPCPRCQAPVVALRGWVEELELADLPEAATASDLSLPARDLVLLRGRSQSAPAALLALTVACGGEV